MKLLVITGYAPSLINFRSHLLKGLLKEKYSITAISRITKEDNDIKKTISLEFSSWKRNVYQEHHLYHVLLY